MMERIAVVSFTNYRESVAKAFDETGAGPVLAKQSIITNLK